MDINKAISFIENSFLNKLLQDPDITDISFNGNYIFFQHNEFGRQLSDILINQSEAKDFIRQIANLTEKQFSYQIPLLDVSIDKYRINAVHSSIGRVGNESAITFSIRIASITPRINDESGFLSDELKALFEVLLNNHCSILIGGKTGTGKTEFQKYLLRKMPENERIIIIDNVLELDQIRWDIKSDINSWQIDDRNDYSSIQQLVKNALRSNPDWLIVAESRGNEMNEILNSAMTGHPIITTLHALNIESMPYRAARMIMMNDKKSEYSEILNDISRHFQIYVYLNKNISSDGHVTRYISSIGEYLSNGQMNMIYKYDKGKNFYNKLSKDFIKGIDVKETTQLFKRAFIGECNE